MRWGVPCAATTNRNAPNTAPIELMKRHVSFAVCLSCLLLPVVPRASAAPNAPVPARDGQRFLFIVDTSSDMEALKDENEATLYDLLRTGLYGQMQTGDTYGVWTYDKETHAGRFPMQVWDARRSTQLATMAAAHLSNQNYENKDDVKRMINLLMTVVQAVSNLNVFVVSDGGSTMRGTPFDKAINAEYKKKHRERNSAKRPFVTTLVARDARIIGQSVIVAGEPIILPERPLPTVAVAKNVPPPNRPAGVILSNKFSAVSVMVPPIVPAAQNPQKQAPAPSATTNAAIVVPPSTNAVIKSEVIAPRVIQIVTTSNSVPAAVEPSPAEPDKTTVAVASDAVQTNSPTSELSLPPPAPPVLADIAVPPPVIETPARHPALAAILPEPVTVAARELHPEPETVTPVQAAGFTVSPGASAGFFLAFGSLLLAAALFLLFVVFRRLRPAPGSLITQSMQRR